MWFKPELALSAADRLHVTGLFAVDWLPVMLISELVLSILMRRQVRVMDGELQLNSQIQHY